jgi:hypothetical protein
VGRATQTVRLAASPCTEAGDLAGRKQALRNGVVREDIVRHVVVAVRGGLVRARHDLVAGAVIAREDHVVARRAAAVLRLAHVGTLVPEVLRESPAHDLHKRVERLIRTDESLSAGIHDRLPVITADSPVKRESASANYFPRKK